MLLGVGLLLLTPAVAQDCVTALDRARQADRAGDFAGLRNPAAQAVACDASNLVAQALLAKAAEYEGDWAAQRDAAAAGEALAADSPVGARFTRSRQRAETLIALDRADLATAGNRLDDVREGLATDDPDVGWVEARDWELEALRTVSRGAPCRTDALDLGSATTVADTVAQRGTADRAPAFAAWCTATQAVADGDPTALTRVLADAASAPVPHVADVLPRQLQTMSFVRDGATAEARAVLDDLRAFTAYPGLEGWIDANVASLRPAPEPSPSRRSAAGPVLIGLGVATAAGGGVLGVLGRQQVDDAVANECGGLGSQVTCSDEGFAQIDQGERRQIVGGVLIGVGGALAVTGVTVRIAGKGRDDAEARLGAQPGGVVLHVRW